MSRQQSVFLSSLLIIGMIQSGCQERALSRRKRSRTVWIVEAALCRSALRRWNFPSGSDSYYGFRVALSSPAGTPK